MPHSLTTQKNGYAVDRVFWEAATPHTVHLPRKWWPAAETQYPSFCWTKCLIWCLFKYPIHSQHKRIVMLLIRSSERLQLPTPCTYLENGGQQPKHNIPVFVEQNVWSGAYLNTTFTHNTKGWLCCWSGLLRGCNFLHCAPTSNMVASSRNTMSQFLLNW